MMIIDMAKLTLYFVLCKFIFLLGEKCYICKSLELTAKMKRQSILACIAAIGTSIMPWNIYASDVTECVDPFIGTTNYGTTNPGAIVPNGLMSVTPFNVMGSDLNRYDKDRRWWSTPYDNTNSYITGFSHVNLSGVGCPEMGSLLVMATTGETDVDYHNYGTTYSAEKASPGYYSVNLDKYSVLAEATASPRTGRIRFTFPAGQSNILLNLGEGLTNESGAVVRRVSDTEVAGSKLMGTFCYTSSAVFPLYFAMRVSKAPKEQGFWKLQRKKGVEAQWDADDGKYKLYTGRRTEVMAGDDIGVWYSYDTTEGESIEVSVGVSFVSEENARMNLDAEQPEGTSFDGLRTAAVNMWRDNLSRIKVEGGTDADKTVFYTALYHTLIHPCVIQDVNGEYPAMESGETMKTDGDRYSVFSLWDTYRNLHQLMSLVWPEKQTEMVRSIVDMYKEWGWLPRWELFGRETFTMEGDPAIPVIVDTWRKGLRGFDMDAAYEGMKKSATTSGDRNPIRRDIDPYIEKGYIPLWYLNPDKSDDNSVSHALEYYVADNALAYIARERGDKNFASELEKRAAGWKNYYSKESGILRPLNADGSFLTPFDPRQGENFEAVPGYHEGSAWNYTFYVPHDIEGLAKAMGGRKSFVDRLQSVFDNGYYDPANEPDIAYPYLFSYFKGEEWRTSKIVKELLAQYYKTTPDGIPGNDDTGTMSAWAVFSMMGFYPDVPGVPEYTLTEPTFDRITISLDPAYHGADSLVIEKKTGNKSGITLGGKKIGHRITHKELLSGAHLVFTQSR
jgi:putative alpha-1,2-mannosidase